MTVIAEAKYGQITFRNKINDYVSIYLTVLQTPLFSLPALRKFSSRLDPPS